MKAIKKLIDRIIWSIKFKAKKGELTCNSCRYYHVCSKYDVEGEYFACGAKHDGAKICKNYKTVFPEGINCRHYLFPYQKQEEDQE